MMDSLKRCENCVGEHMWCKKCLKKSFTNWTSGNIQIDNLIQETQLNINYYEDIVFEWIPYYQFDHIKKLSNKIYTAKWKDGPLYWSERGRVYFRKPYKNVALKYLANSQNIINEFLNEVCKLSINSISIIFY
jgi:hypothetical protein